jgi:hypothetical protein
MPGSRCNCRSIIEELIRLSPSQQPIKLAATKLLRLWQIGRDGADTAARSRREPKLAQELVHQFELFVGDGEPRVLLHVAGGQCDRGPAIRETMWAYDPQRNSAIGTYRAHYKNFVVNIAGL